eukprot:2984235-Rhodomonas_salina.1
MAQARMLSKAAAEAVETGTATGEHVTSPPCPRARCAKDGADIEGGAVPGAAREGEGGDVLPQVCWVLRCALPALQPASLSCSPTLPLSAA